MEGETVMGIQINSNFSIPEELVLEVTGIVAITVLDLNFSAVMLLLIQFRC